MKRAMYHLAALCCFALCLLSVARAAAADVQLTAQQQAKLAEAAKINKQVIELYNKGEYKSALAPAKQALTLCQEAVGNKHLATANMLSELGELSLLLGDFAAAKQYSHDALDVRRELLGPKHASTALSLNNLGNMYGTMGDYTAARPYFEQALAIRKEVLGVKHADTAKSLDGLGDVYKVTGDFTAAKSHYEQALAIRKEVLGPKHADTAASYNRLGLLLKNMGDYAAAKPYYEQALAVRQEVLGPKHPDTAQALSNMGYLLYAMGDYQQAKRFHEQGLKIRLEVYGPSHYDTSESYNGLGLILFALGDYAAARQNFESALNNVKQTLGLRHPNTTASLNNLAVLCATTGDWRRAGELERQARQGVRDHVAHILPALSQKIQLHFVQFQDEYPFYDALSLGMYSQEHPPLASLSAEFLANGKAVIQESLAEGAALALASEDPQLKKLVQRLQDARREFARQAQITPAANEAQAYRQKLEALEKQERDLADQVNRSLKRLDRQRWITQAEVLKGLPAGGVLVDVARIKPQRFTAKGGESRFPSPRYIAWIIPASGAVQVIDLGDAQKIDVAVTAFRTMLNRCQSTDSDQNPLVKLGEAEAEKILKQSLADLGKLILNPLYPHLKNASELLLSPDASLWLIPWAALPVPGDENLYVVEKWSIRYVTSAREVAVQFGKPSTNPPRIFANPNYDLPVGDVPIALASVFGGAKPANSATNLGNLLAGGDLRSRSASTLGKVPRLPGTAQEAATITPSLKRMTSNEPKTYADNLALEGVFKRLSSPRVLVLSTHGFFLSDQQIKSDVRQGVTAIGDAAAKKAAVDQEGNAVENPLVRCGLLLAACNNSDKLAAKTDLDDGILTGMEIVGTDLHGTELVVLSACETGLGKVNNGEGVAGLRQAFQLAGAHAVVATLWQIPDVQSAVLMNDFFANLAAGQSKSNALRNAQLARIKARREKFGAAHPLFWAAFTLTGGN